MSNTVYKDSNSVATILAIKNQMSANLGIGFEMDISTTLNYKHKVLETTEPKQFPKIRYFGIGIKGYANLTSENNISQPYMPKPTDCDLYEPIPFRCVTKPLTGAEAEQYRICTKVSIDGRTYYQYWLKLITFESNTPKTTKIVGDIESDYSISTSDLNPVPTDLFATDLSDSTERIIASVTGICRVTGAEVTEVINAMYGGDMRRARISEIGIYSGVEVAVAGDGEFPDRTESAYTQLCNHKCTIGQALTSEDAVMVERTVFENGSCVSI